MIKRVQGGWLGMAFVLLWAGGAWALPGNLVLQVPDWNQPADYGVAGYPNWCSPTAGGNLMGFWEDVLGCTGLTDRQVMPAGPGYANTANTYQQGLFNDGEVEMGYYMGTDGWAPPPNTQFPPLNTGTALALIGPGVAAYAAGAWVDPGSGITKVSYPNLLLGKDTAPPNAVMWVNYRAEIDAGRPVLCSFDKWVDTTKFTGTVQIDGFPGQNIEDYTANPWDLLMDMGHTVVGVGYIDLTPGFQNNGTDEWFVCQDGWPGPGGGVVGTTAQFVRVPVDTFWQQNDYVYYVPEPATMGLLLLGSLGVAALRKRRR